MSGKDVLALDPTERPNCVYEEQEYRALTFFLEKKKVSKEEPILDEGGVTLGTEVASVPMTSSAAKAAQDAQHFSSGNLGTGTGPIQSDRSDLSLESSGCDAAASDPASVSFGSTFSFPKEKVEEAVEAVEEESAAVPLLHHNIATYQVMLTRAQAALAVSRLVDDTVAEGERYSMKSSKVAALLQAELRIGRELRQWIRLLANDAVRFALGLGPVQPDDPEPEGPRSLHEFMVPILKKAEGVLEHALVPTPPRPNPNLEPT